MTYKIEKGIPLPTKGKGVYNKATQIREALHKMEIGDSILFPKSEFYNFHNAKKFMNGNKKFTTRKVNNTESRIFRIA